jgi:glycine cleavage system H protein
MNPKECMYTKDHEWIRPQQGKIGKMGLANYAQSQLGDIVYLDLPDLGIDVKQFQKMGEVESVKAVSDIYSPISGKIIKVNHAVIDEPKLVNEAPYDTGWLVEIEISDPKELEALMNVEEYDKLVDKLNISNEGGDS